MNPHSTRRTSSSSDWIFLGLVLLLAFALRCVGMNYSFIEDEFRTYARSAHGFWYAWTGSAEPVSHLLAATGLFFGESESWLRVPFLMVGMGNILMLYFFAKRATDQKTGLLAALGLAVSAFHVQWSHIARYYVIIMMLSILCIWVMERAFRTGQIRFWILFTLFCAVGFLTHATFFPVVGVIAGAGVLWNILHERQTTLSKRLRQIFILTVCVVVGFSSTIVKEQRSFSRFLNLMNIKRTAPASVAAPVAQSTMPNFETRMVAYGADPKHLPELYFQSPHLLFRLSPSEFYGQYINEIFPGFADTALKKLLFAAILVYGMVRLYQKAPLIGLSSAAVFWLLPIPFLLITSRHVFAARYFAALVPVAFLFLSEGIVGLAQLVRHVLSKMSLPVLVYVERFMLAAFVAVLLLFPAADGLQQYYKTRPDHDWKGMSRKIAEYAQRDDLLLYYGPWDWGYYNFRVCTSSSLARYTSPNCYFSLRREWCTTSKSILKLACENPDKTIWIATDCSRMPRDHYYALTRLFPGAFRFGYRPQYRFTLDVLGEPTTNLCRTGGFEDSVSRAGAESISTESFDGSASLKLSNEDVQQNSSTYAEFPIGPTVYPVRNSSFDYWKDNVPVGWTVSGNGNLFRNCEEKPKETVLTVLDNTEDIVLTQALATPPSPGMTVMATLWGKCSSSDQLSLAIEFSQSGQKKRIIATHSGNGEWEQMACTAPIPTDVDPKTVACAVLFSAGRPHAAHVDNIQLSAVQPLLDPQLPYTLSMRVKNLNQLEELFSVAVKGERTDGTAFQKVILPVPDLASDWRLISTPVTPGVHIPEDTHKLNIIVGLSPKVKGTLWLDNIQFEAKDHPTPFTTGTRPSHDELFDIENPPGHQPYIPD